MTLNQREFLNKKEKESSIKADKAESPNFNTKMSSHSTHTNNRRKTLYVFNFTTARLLSFLLIFVSIILFVFVIGVQVGKSKSVYAYNDINNNNTDTNLLLRNDENIDNLIDNVPVNNDVSESSDFIIVSNDNDSIIREGSTPEDRYNEYTQSLALELDSINSNIRKKDFSGLKPNTTYTPPGQLASVVPMKSSTEVTRVPYTKSSSVNSVYFIQVAVGYDKEHTYSERDNLKKKFPKAFVKEETTNDGTMMYKLKIGRYDSREDALVALSEVRKIPAYKDSYIYSDKKNS